MLLGLLLTGVSPVKRLDRTRVFTHNNPFGYLVVTITAFLLFGRFFNLVAQPCSDSTSACVDSNILRFNVEYDTRMVLNTSRRIVVHFHLDNPSCTMATAQTQENLFYSVAVIATDSSFDVKPASEQKFASVLTRVVQPTQFDGDYTLSWVIQPKELGQFDLLASIAVYLGDCLVKLDYKTLRITVTDGLGLDFNQHHAVKVIGAVLGAGIGFIFSREWLMKAIGKGLGLSSKRQVRRIRRNTQSTA